MSQHRTGAAVQRTEGTNAGLKVYLLFVASWFLHLPARVPVLGAIRFDLMLVVVLAFLAYQQSAKSSNTAGQTARILTVLMTYAVLSTPFVEWPGSVWKTGLPEFGKAVVFFYFSLAFIRSPSDLRLFINTFIGCQVLRVLEPLFLHLTTGYWGSAASMEGGREFLYRLSGAPDDVINPNGLAFLVCTVLPFLYFLSTLSWKHRVALVSLAPLCLYAFSLTGSRSGMVGLAVVLLGIFIKSKHRVIIGSLCTGAVLVSFTMMSGDMQDRYLSIFGMGEKNAGTASERWDGMRAQFDVALRRPIVGHGLGTSLEANAHFTRFGPYVNKPIHAHNIFLEAVEEIGLVGLVILIAFLVSIFQDFRRTRQLVLKDPAGHDPLLLPLLEAMQVWLALNLVSGLTSYGLSTYDWYLFGGLSLVIQRIVLNSTNSTNTLDTKTKSARPARRSKNTLSEKTREAQ